MAIEGLGYIVGYRLAVPCTDGTVTTATRMDSHDRLFDRFEDEVDDLFAVGHSLVTVEWDTIDGQVEFTHFVLAFREDRPRQAKVWRLSPPDPTPPRPALHACNGTSPRRGDDR